MTLSDCLNILHVIRPTSANRQTEANTPEKPSATTSAVTTTPGLNVRQAHRARSVRETTETFASQFGFTFGNQAGFPIRYSTGHQARMRVPVARTATSHSVEE